MAKRRCFECEEEGHLARNCPKKKDQPSRSLRAIEDMPFFGRNVNAVLDPGFELPRKTAHPTPSSRTLMDFWPTPVKNKFDLLTAEDPDHSEEPSTDGGARSHYVWANGGPDDRRHKS